MKISHQEFGKAAATGSRTDGKILPEDRPRGAVSSRTETTRKLSPLEKGMEVAENALAGVPDVREDIVQTLKERIQKGEYDVKGEDVAEMMLRRLSADRVR